MTRLPCLFALALFCGYAMSQTPEELAALKAQKEAMEYQAAIEKAKADIAKARQDQIRSATQDVTVAEEAKKKAEAERAEFLAKLPPVEAKALAGTVGVEGVKLLAMPPILSRLDTEADKLCKSLGTKVLPYDKTVLDGMTRARVVKDQISILDEALRDVATPKDPKVDPGRAAPLFAVVAATTAVKAAADLASLFKTNVVTGRAELADAKALFLNMMAGHCAGKLLYFPGSYLGELDLTEYEALNKSIESLLKNRYAVGRIGDQKQAELTEGRVTEKKHRELKESLEKKGPKMSDEERAALQDTIAALASRERTNQSLLKETAAIDDLLKQTDAFLQGLKITDSSGSGPLFNVARLLTLGRKSNDATVQILDFEVKAEGITVIKDNLFTGQRLRIAGAAILNYKIFDRAGSITSAKVLPIRADFVELDLRQESLSGDN